MENLNKAIMHYNRDKFFTRDMLIGIEDEIPGSLSGDIVLSTLDDRVIIDDDMIKLLEALIMLLIVHIQ